MRSRPVRRRVPVAFGLAIHRVEVGRRSDRCGGFATAATRDLRGCKRTVRRGFGARVGVTAAGSFVRALVLLHVVFARKGLVAGRAGDVFLAGVLFAVTGSMARGGECVGARVTVGVRTGILFLDGFR